MILTTPTPYPPTQHSYFSFSRAGSKSLCEFHSIDNKTTRHEPWVTPELRKLSAKTKIEHFLNTDTTPNYSGMIDKQLQILREIEKL